MWFFKWKALFRRLDIIEAKLDRSLRMEMHTMAIIDDLTAAVAAQKSVDDSIEALLDTLAAQQDPAALQQLVADLQANTAKVQAAIVKNTPVAPTQAAATT